MQARPQKMIIFTNDDVLFWTCSFEPWLQLFQLMYEIQFAVFFSGCQPIKAPNSIHAKLLETS